MAYEGEGIDLSLPAGGDLSSYQYRIIAIDANGRGTIQTTVGGTAVGVLQNKPSAADVPARVRIAGVTKIKVNAAVNDGVLLTNNVQGFGVAAGTAGHFCSVITLHSAGGSADVITGIVVHMNSV